MNPAGGGRRPRFRRWSNRRTPESSARDYLFCTYDRRTLTHSRRRTLARRSTRKLGARDRALIAAQLFLGFRISEIIALTVGHVLHEGRIRPRVALPPRFLKGGYGGTRSIPVGPEVHRALEKYLTQRARYEALKPDAPLFLSRQQAAGGVPHAICRSSGEKIIKRALIPLLPTQWDFRRTPSAIVGGPAL